MTPEVFVVLVMGGFLVAIALVLFWPTGRSKTETSAKSHLTYPLFRNNDRYWVGFFYNNPEDPDVIVPRRSGFGWTINFGHPQGKRFLIAMLLVILVSVVLSVLAIFFPGAIHLSGCHTLGCVPR